MVKSVNTIKKTFIGPIRQKPVQYGYFPYWPNSSQSSFEWGWNFSISFFLTQGSCRNYAKYVALLYHFMQSLGK